MTPVIQYNNYVADTEVGYGLFAGKVYAPGDIVEQCVTTLPFKLETPPDELKRYLFWNTAAPDEKIAVLGNGMIINHSDHPNMTSHHDASKRLMTFTSVKPIEIGDQLFHDYTDDYFTSNRVEKMF
jgi:hypothetical protein